VGAKVDPLMTYHPHGGYFSSLDFHDDAWLDFNMIQSGHCRDFPVYDNIASDYRRTPAKPTLDAEPGYENIPSCLEESGPRLDDYDVRKSAYLSVFAGALGHAYGSAEVFSLWSPGDDNPMGWFETPWREALDYPGAAQMRHLRALMESRPLLTRVPDPALLLSSPGQGGSRVEATRDEEGRYAMLYSSAGHPMTVDLARLAAEEVEAHWYDPREGTALHAGRYPTSQPHTFTPPRAGLDWVLVLDDPAQGFPPPGR
jgi:hypothetical protein